MRIVAGEYGGRRLEEPKGRDIRPTSDKVRGAIFNMLRARGAVEDARVLDAFCGSGALGLEALSQGAAFCCFSDIAFASISLTKRNIEALGAGERTQVIMRDSSKIGQRRDEEAPYDLVFLDPPYRKGLVDLSLTLLRDGNWLRPSAFIVAESERGALPEVVAGYEQLSLKNYGETDIALYSFIG